MNEQYDADVDEEGLIVKASCIFGVELQHQGRIKLLTMHEFGAKAEYWINQAVLSDV